MRNIFNYIVIGILAVITSLYVFCTVSYASALPTDPLALDPSELTVLEGGNGAFNAYIPSNYNPDIYAFGFDMILNDINNDLYNKYGWDLQDASWYIEDINQENIQYYDSITSEITGGLYQTYQEALNAGYMFFTRSVPFAWNYAQNQAKTMIMGKISEGTNKIVNVFNSSVLPFTQDYMDNFVDLFEQLEGEEVIENISENSLLYGNSFNLNATTDIGTYPKQCVFSLDKKMFLYGGRQFNGSSSGDNKVYWMRCVIPAEGVNPRNIPASGVFLLPDGTSHAVTQLSLYSYNTVTVNGINYYEGLLYVNGYYCLSDFQYPVVGTVESMIENLFQGGKPYVYNWGADSRLREIIGRLNGNYVTSNDLKDIKDIMEQVPIAPKFYPNPSPNGSPALGAEPSPPSDFWDVLDGKVDEILQNSVFINPVLPTLPDSSTNPNPNPDPDPNPNPDPDSEELPTGIGVPEDFPTDIFDPFTDVLKMPFSLLSVFEPIFYMFNHTLLFPLWLLVPCFIVICFIIWALK